MNFISVKASAKKKGHSANRSNMLNNWNLTLSKISTNRHRLIYNSIFIPQYKILADPYLRSFKNSGSVFRAHKHHKYLNITLFTAIQQ